MSWLCVTWYHKVLCLLDPPYLISPQVPVQDQARDQDKTITWWNPDYDSDHSYDYHFDSLTMASAMASIPQWHRSSKSPEFPFLYQSVDTARLLGFNVTVARVCIKGTTLVNNWYLFHIDFCVVRALQVISFCYTEKSLCFMIKICNKYFPINSYKVP